MKSLKSILILVVICSLSFSVLAQKGQQNFDPQKMIENQMPKIQSKLELDDLQTALVKNILLKYTKEKMALRSTEENKEVVFAKMKEINKNQKEELAAVLTEEQMITYQEMQKKRQKKRGYQGKKRNF